MRAFSLISLLVLFSFTFIVQSLDEAHAESVAKKEDLKSGDELESLFGDDEDPFVDPPAIDEAAKAEPVVEVDPAVEKARKKMDEQVAAAREKMAQEKQTASEAAELETDAIEQELAAAGLAGEESAEEAIDLGTQVQADADAIVSEIEVQTEEASQLGADVGTEPADNLGNLETTAKESAAQALPEVKKEATKVMPKVVLKKVSKKKARPGFKVTVNPCKVHEQAESGSKVVNTLAGNKKLWTEPHSDQFLKVYTKRGPAFVGYECFQ